MTAHRFALAVRVARLQRLPLLGNLSRLISLAFCLRQHSLSLGSAWQGSAVPKRAGLRFAGLRRGGLRHAWWGASLSTCADSLPSPSHSD